ncbi:ubiquinol oxidase subunit II (plasmid) [Sphingomonas paeninsulae]|uniref:Ubiquinol oxidase subunit II n=1 Tax=Sphingomonas paeninsulae TaxID=2319844 RepID=A0A494THE0_SPHPE|nr:ubiquinol oxidase subunit II [Sphingomonas paeninsulae]AYJ84595.1 ubiquinol oxidase subunit II [Sphingomonas paeninsulae]
MTIRGNTRLALRGIGIMALMLLSGCDVLRLGVVGHAGPVAEGQWHLYLVVGAVLIFVAGPVLLLTPIMAWHYRLSNTKSAFKPKWDFSWWIEALIWIPPIVIVIGLGVVLWTYTHLLDPYRPIPSPQAPLEIQAVALDWKWLFIYPGEQIATVNELDIPVGRPVHISLTSGTVMQSLMVPQLAGQIYAMAGMTTQLNFAASRAGVFHGQNTQFNGIGFQNQKFNVIARPAPQYRHWVDRVHASGQRLDAASYARLSARSVIARPVFFASTPPNLFSHIVAQTPDKAR